MAIIENKLQLLKKKKKGGKSEPSQTTSAPKTNIQFQMVAECHGMMVLEETQQRTMQLCAQLANLFLVYRKFMIFFGYGRKRVL